jgi:hypothetical protein
MLCTLYILVEAVSLSSIFQFFFLLTAIQSTIQSNPCKMLWAFTQNLLRLEKKNFVLTSQFSTQNNLTPKFKTHVVQYK